MAKPNKDAKPAASELLLPAPRFGLRLDRQRLIRVFFSGNAAVTILVLALIIWSLLREGSGFFATYQWELSVYRKAGLEYCDMIRKPIEEHAELSSKINRALMAEINSIAASARQRRDAAYLIKARVEERTTLLSEQLREALAATVPNPERTANLRAQSKQASRAAVEQEAIPEVFSDLEKEKLRSEIAALEPDQESLPAFMQSLVDEAANQESLAREKFAIFVKAAESFEAAIEPIAELHDGMKAMATATREAAYQQHMAEDAKAKLLQAAGKAKLAEDRQAFERDAAQTDTAAIDYASKITPILQAGSRYTKLGPEYVEAAQKIWQNMPTATETAEAKNLLAEARKRFPTHIKHVNQAKQWLSGWRWDEPISKIRAGVAFFFGGDWITNSSWQDFYGFVPLLAGSFTIASIAMLIAMPFSIAAAIYTNQFAKTREQELIKPSIEFIQAIPSVVLGFIGISVVGDLIQRVSHVAWLQWVPGFPIAERLNMFNAGCLLALMAVPTMFSLAEDAINNVPRSLSEASEALGATKLQTTFRVIVPASMSGIAAAMLLGLGRIIGETMVVLLVAGNRIKIPGFSDGIGAIFEPAHTLTGIIAQELGEVSRGSSHWQALFMVGIVLFALSLIINWLARFILHRFQLARI